MLMTAISTTMRAEARTFDRPGFLNVGGGFETRPYQAHTHRTTILSDHNNSGADLHAAIEINDVFVPHADAS